MKRQIGGITSTLVRERFRLQRIFPRIVLLLLAGISLWPAWRGWRLIAEYAEIPVIDYEWQGELHFLLPGMQLMYDGQGIAVSRGGTIVVADLSGPRLLAFPDGTSSSSTIFAPAKDERKMQAPFALAAGPDETIHALDMADGRVYSYDKTGKLLRTKVMASNGSRAIAVDLESNIYVADYESNVVRKYLPSGYLDAGWGDTPARGGVAHIPRVVGLSVFEGDLCATSSRDNAIIRLNALGEIVSKSSLRGLAGPLTHDIQGNLYMSDLLTNRVWVFKRFGNSVARIVGSGGNQESFAQPRGISAPAEGLLYVVSDTHITIYRRKP